MLAVPPEGRVLVLAAVDASGARFRSDELTFSLCVGK
jgi:hypothetical protein